MTLLFLIVPDDRTRMFIRDQGYHLVCDLGQISEEMGGVSDPGYKETE